MTEERCRYCGGHLTGERVTRVEQYRGRYYAIENLRALVCRQCGECYYTPAVHDLVLLLVRGEGRPIREERLQVYDAASLA